MATKSSSVAEIETLSSSSEETTTPTPPVLNNIDPEHASRTINFFKHGTSKPIPQGCNTPGFYSNFIGSFINVHRVQKGRLSCSVSVKPPICNVFKIMHGGSVGSVTEMLATACARTVVAEDKELFLGEMSLSYLSGAPTNEEVVADASVVKSGRNVTVVALEYKLKRTGNLVYIAHATFYNLPISKL